MTTDNKGVLTLYYSESFVIPSNFTSFNSTIIDIQILPFDVVNLKFLNFTWNVTDFTNTKLVV